MSEKWKMKKWNFTAKNLNESRENRKKWKIQKKKWKIRKDRQKDEKYFEKIQKHVKKLRKIDEKNNRNFSIRKYWFWEKNKNREVSLKWFQGLKSITWQNKFKHVWKNTTVIQNGRQGNMSYQFKIYFKGSAGLWLKGEYNQHRYSLCEHYCKNYVYFTKKRC